MSSQKFNTKKCHTCNGGIPKLQYGGDPTSKKALAQKVVDNARRRINNNSYAEVPESLKKIAKDRNEQANSCIGGVCTVLKESGVMNDVNWSNTDFALKAKDYGFPNNGYGVKGLKNLEPGDVLQHNNDINSQGSYYPGHSQIFLGKNDNGEYEFFDNYRGGAGEGGLKTYNEEELALWLDPKRNKTQRSASIYKVNDYTPPTAIQMSPEAISDSRDRQTVKDYNLNNRSNYKYSIRQDSKDYNEDTAPMMNQFVEFANNDENINELVKKTGKSKEEIHDSLLNVFGELGQENKWQNRTFAGSAMGLEGFFEKVFKPKNKSIGPGQIKFNTIPKDLKDNFGIKKPKDLFDLNKVMPLMAAMDLKDKQVLTNWGNKNTLTDKLINKTDTEFPVTAEDLKGGVGRWSPYLRNQYSSIAKGSEDANFKLDEGSYPDKVFRNIDNNLERKLNLDEGEYNQQFLPEVTVKSKINKKFQVGGDNQYADTSVFDLIAQYSQQPRQQIEEESPEETSAPSEENDFSYRDEDFKALQDKYDSLEEKINNINGISYSGSDDFMNFLFDDSKTNEPINFNKYLENRSRYGVNLTSDYNPSSGSAKDEIAKRESGGDYGAFTSAGGGAGAVGKYQFRWNLHKQDIENVTGVGDREAFRNNPQAQEQYFNHWENNVLIPEAQRLQQIVPNVPLKEIEKQIHFSGVQGARDYYTKGKITTDAYGTTNKTYQIGGDVSSQGYNYDSPYRNEPYLDIHTPTGEITMENTPHPLLGIGQNGEQKLMFPGKKYKFDSKIVKEIKL